MYKNIVLETPSYSRNLTLLNLKQLNLIVSSLFVNKTAILKAIQDICENDGLKTGFVPAYLPKSIPTLIAQFEQLPLTKKTIVSDVLKATIGKDSIKNLSSSGSGALRLLQVSMAAVNINDGILLIDEAFRSLHYLVIPVLWIFLAQAAREFNLQIFLTTDRLNGCVGCEDLGDIITVSRVEKDRDFAINFNRDEIIAAEKFGLAIF